MIDHELEQRLRTWYRVEVPPDEAAPTELRASVVAIPRVNPTPLRLLGARRTVRLLAIAAVLTTAAVGAALLAGSGPFRLPSVLPPSNGPTTAPPPVVQPSDEVEPVRIVYTRWRMVPEGDEGCTSVVACQRASVFTSNADGTGERELVPGPFSYLESASRDGSTLVVYIREATVGAWYLTDASGSTPQ